MQIGNDVLRGNISKALGKVDCLDSELAQVSQENPFPPFFSFLIAFSLLTQLGDLGFHSPKSLL